MSPSCRPPTTPTRLASSTIDTTTDPAPVWRALGLLNGELDLDAIGRQAMNDSPAFYDPATKTIFVSNDLKAFEHLYRFALRRSLTTALLDQQFDWSARLSTTSPAAALGLRATIDGDALAVANALAAERRARSAGARVPLLRARSRRRRFRHHRTRQPSPVVPAWRCARPWRRWPMTLSSLAALEQATPSSDAVLDVARLAPTTRVGTTDRRG